MTREITDSSYLLCMHRTVKLTGKEQEEDAPCSARMGLQSRVVCSRRSSKLLDCQTNHLCATMVNCATEVSFSGVLVRIPSIE